MRPREAVDPPGRRAGQAKLIVNHLDRLFVTTDAATIINELEVEHPAAKLLVLASQQQEHEVGDGTNFVLMFAGQLLAKAEGLLEMGLSPAEIVTGYEHASRKVLEILPELVCATVGNVRDKEEVFRALRPCIMSKQNGHEDFLARLVAEACVETCPPEKVDFNVDHVRVAKILGQGVVSSTMQRGMIFRREMAGAISAVESAKVAVYTGAVDWVQTETKGTVLINSADELKGFSNSEEAMLERQIKAIADSGCNVVVTGSKFGEMATHFCQKYKLFMVKILSKHEIRRLCKAIGAVPLPRLTPPAPNEIGHCDSVRVDEVGDVRVSIFEQTAEKSDIATIIIRGATDNICDDVQRAVNDGVNVYKAITRDPRQVPGAGATEIELALRLAKYAEAQPGLEQYAIQAFAEAFEVIPHTLAETAGVKAKEAVSLLYAAHARGEGAAGFDNTAVDAAVTDVVAAGILDNLPT